jgi:prevent-host-death family protein
VDALGIEQARSRLGDIVNAVSYNPDIVTFISRNGRPAAAVVSVDVGQDATRYVGAPHAPDVDRVACRANGWLTTVTQTTTADLTERQRGQMDAWADALHAATQDNHFASRYEGGNEDPLTVLREWVDQLVKQWSLWCATRG